MPNIVGCLRVLDEMSEFFREEEEEEEEVEKKFSQYGEGGVNSLYVYNNTKRHHFVHTEDDSIVKQMRGY